MLENDRKCCKTLQNTPKSFKMLRKWSQNLNKNPEIGTDCLALFTLSTAMYVSTGVPIP